MKEITALIAQNLYQITLLGKDLHWERTLEEEVLIPSFESGTEETVVSQETYYIQERWLLGASSKRYDGLPTEL